jgi:nicotinamide riboside transporter PnuC
MVTFGNPSWMMRPLTPYSVFPWKRGERERERERESAAVDQPHRLAWRELVFTGR